MYKRLKSSTIAVCLYSLFFLTSNADADDIDIYVSAGGGTSSLDFKLKNTSSSGEFWSTSTTHKDIDDSLITKRLIVGFQFHKYYGIEVALTDFDEFSYTRESTDLNNYPGSTSTSTRRYTKKEKNRGLSLSHAFFFPVTNWFAFNVNAGAIAMQRKTDESTYSRSEYTPDGGETTVSEGSYETSGDSMEIKATLGLGAVFYAGKHFGVKLGWERNFQTFSENLDVDVVSLDLRYIF
jgi:hypothetical protein